QEAAIPPPTIIGCRSRSLATPPAPAPGSARPRRAGPAGLRGPPALLLDVRRLDDEGHLDVHVVLDDLAVAHHGGALDDVQAGDVAQARGGARHDLLGGVTPALVRDAHEFHNPPHRGGPRAPRPLAPETPP